MTPYLFWELIILIVGVWAIAILFFVYGWILLKRQRKMILDLMKMQNIASDQKEESKPVHLEISKDEPISKYENLKPEEADVSFVDKNE